MGSDPKSSVIDSDHRTHDVKNLFLCDGSSFVTSGRGQPTMTIEALAFRAADRIKCVCQSAAISARNFLGLRNALRAGAASLLLDSFHFYLRCV